MWEWRWVWGCMMPNIQVDGVDIAAMDELYYRQHLALVSQQPELFENTIANNITYGMKAAVEQR